MFDIIFPISNNSEIKLGIPISRLKLNLEFELDTSTNKKVGAAKDHGEKATFLIVHHLLRGSLLGDLNRATSRIKFHSVIRAGQ